jgi:hypothetical protein
LHGTALALALRDPRRIRRALRARGEQTAQRRVQSLREAVLPLDRTTRERLDAILADYLAIHRECAAPEVSRWAREPLGATLGQIEGLIAQAAELAARRAELAAFLEGVNRSELHGQHASLQARAGHCADPVQRAQLEQSLRFKKQEIDAYDTIGRAVTRVDGQLESLECAFAALKARLFRFKSDEKTEWAAAGEQLSAEMNALSTQVDALNESVREVLALRGGT